MNEELKQLLDWMNANLNAIALNQAILYAELQQIERLLDKPYKPED